LAVIFVQPSIQHIFFYKRSPLQNAFFYIKKKGYLEPRHHIQKPQNLQLQKPQNLQPVVLGFKEEKLVILQKKERKTCNLQPP